MLRKIEQQLDYLSEARDYISKKKGGDLDQREMVLRDKRKKNRQLMKKQIADQIKKEKDDRAIAKRNKQDMIKVFKGRKDTFRSNKRELKPKEDNEQKQDEETMDMNRYLFEGDY